MSNLRRDIDLEPLHLSEMLRSVACVMLQFVGAGIVVAQNHYGEMLDHVIERPRAELVGALTAAVVFLSLSMRGIPSWELWAITVIVFGLLGLRGGHNERKSEAPDGQAKAPSEVTDDTRGIAGPATYRGDRRYHFATDAAYPSRTEDIATELREHFGSHDRVSVEEDVPRTRRPRRNHVKNIPHIYLLVFVLIGSAWSSILFAPASEQAATGSLALVTTIFALLVFVPQTDAVYRWLQIGAVLHALLILGSGMFGVERPDGLGYNPNPAAGLLVLVLAYRLAQRLPRPEDAITTEWIWARRMEGLAPFVVDGLLLAGIAATGSRWAVAVTFVITLAMAAILIEQLPFRRILAMLTIAMLLLLPQADSVVENLRLNRNIMADLTARTAISESVGLAPHGSIGRPDLHTAPVRVAVEWGTLAAAAWLWLVLRAAWAARRGPVLWMVVPMLALSLVDYYFVLSLLTPLFYVLVSTASPEPPSGR